MDLIKTIKHLLTKTEKATNYNSDESLAVSRKKDFYQFYYHKKHNSKRIYIKKENREHAEKLAQRDYALKLSETLNKALEILKESESINIENLETEVFESLPDYKKTLVKRYYTPSDIFAESWENNHYNVSTAGLNNTTLFTTLKKDKVRSKSELIIANYLFNAKVPYHYEEQLFLPSYGNIYPDFTILNKRTRKVYIWEHFGLMSNPDYAEKAVSKILTYQQNGYYSGEQIIYTFETQTVPLDPQIVLDIINKYLI